MQKHLSPNLISLLSATGPAVATSTTSFQQLSAIPRSTPLVEVSFPYNDEKNPNAVNYFTSKSASDQLAACRITEVKYVGLIYLSSQRETMGLSTKGAHVELYGYHLETGANGDPLLDDNDNHIMITTDDQGNPIEPILLGTLRMMWGRQPNSNSSSDEITFPTPSFTSGIPTKTGESKKTNRSYTSVNWGALMPGGETSLKAPLIHAAAELRMAGVTPDECLASLLPEDDESEGKKGKEKKAKSQDAKVSALSTTTRNLGAFMALMAFTSNAPSNQAGTSGSVVMESGSPVKVALPEDADKDPMAE